jgi:hypothetical protein
MAFPEFPTTEAALVQEYNGETYNASTNPYGLAKGGHRQNWAPAMNALGVIADYVGATADELQTVAAQVALDAAAAAAGSGTEASVADIRAAADVAHYISMRRAVAAQVPVALTDGATISWDMDTGINFSVTLGAAGRALANPTNQVAGKSGFINVVQDGSGGRTITTWGDDFVWLGDEPLWPTAAGAVTKIAYFVRVADSKIELAFAGNMAS